ncbi:AAA family ATPase [Aliterella atlantica]|uniref:Poly(A) polymerase n=1 Tax=Aliterella atlantica CENA595 TaxID=1618023 RepID=A0A0D8ZUP8_9CYAN|nr:AAA family ATPase [Aliterella atlantica]KJH72455.1 poly(A) polymerase [Aliterella atlantica CENA595]
MNTNWIFPYCPEVNQSIDWSSLEQFDWLRSLANCPQDPIYHAEGDVLTHTKLVCEALVSLLSWQQLPAIERSILFAAALLHDVAKPQATQEVEGRIASKGHVRQGARLARRILRDLDAPFQIREAIAQIVQLGSLPLWFWDKPNPQRSVIAASYTTRCDWLALMAQADVLGRICADRNRLLDTIEFFREYCQEQDCWNQPRAFASDLSRFVYFHKENGDPNYVAYDDTNCQVILMSGLPGVGKDRWIADRASNYPVISLDRIRQELNIAPETDQGAVVCKAKQLAKEMLRSQTSFVWNATNISQQVRAGLIDLFAAYRSKIRIVYLEVPWETLLQQNRQRPQPVPEIAIARLFDRLEVPSLVEAHQVEVVDFDYSIKK